VADELPQPTQPDPEAPPSETPPPDPMADMRAELAQARADMAQMREQNQATLQMMQQGFSMLASSRNEPQPTVQPEISDEKLNEMYAEGRAAEAMRIVAQREAAAQNAALRRDAIDPLKSQVEDSGIPALASLAFQAARPELEDYDEFKPQIDEAIQRLHPSLRIRPENVKAAYAIVVGQPENVKKLKQRAFEAGVRTARENPGSLPGTAGRTAPDAEEKLPTPMELKERGFLDQAAVDMIKGYGGVSGFEERYILKQKKHDGSPRFPNGYADWVKDFDTEGVA